MEKSEVINCIREINRSVTVEYLDDFSQEELTQYLERLMELDLADVTVAN
jgi:hypothetical protein